MEMTLRRGVLGGGGGGRLVEGGGGAGVVVTAAAFSVDVGFGVTTGGLDSVEKGRTAMISSEDEGGECVKISNSSTSSDEDGGFSASSSDDDGSQSGTSGGYAPLARTRGDRAFIPRSRGVEWASV